MGDSLSNIEKKINHKIQELKDMMEKTNQRTRWPKTILRMTTIETHRGASPYLLADTGNNRVLLYSMWSNTDLEHLFFSGQSDSLVLDQRNFTSNFTRVSSEGAGSPPHDPLDASLVPRPKGIAFDVDRNLWVARWARVLRFCFPITSSQPSSIVVGKPDFVTPLLIAII
jgi:hypothetical protein